MPLFAEPSNQAYEDIEGYVIKNGDAPENWFVGIATNWVARLFSDHKVIDGETLYIVRKCRDNAKARAVKAALLSMECDGGQVGGNNTALYVYAYQKSKDTRP